MTQMQIDRLVSLATGESLREVHRRGFGIADPLDVNFDPESCRLPPRIVDWDASMPSVRAFFRDGNRLILDRQLNVQRLDIICSVGSAVTDGGHARGTWPPKLQDSGR